MPNLDRIRRFATPSWVSAEALNVSPELVGMPLARPGRRALAIALDAMLVGLLSNSGALWLPASIAALAWWLRQRRAMKPPARNGWLWVALVLLVWATAQQAANWHQEASQPTPGARAGAADTQADSDEDARGALAASAAVSPQVGAALRQASDAARIAALEQQLAHARMPRPLQWREEVEAWAGSLGLGFGWALAYFTLLPYWWSGQTLGKKLLGLRVVELTGKALTLQHCLGRYGGYAAGMATGMVGFAQVLWDPNRQGIQDKIAHTVVLDLKLPRRVDPPGPAAQAREPAPAGTDDPPAV